MASYFLGILGFGLLVLLVAWLPRLLRRVALSLPIVCVAIGAIIFRLAPLSSGLSGVNEARLYEHLTEAVLLIALMGAGLSIDRSFTWRGWRTTWRLIGIGMPLMMVATALLARYGAGFAWPGAVLLAGMLAPTDPVLAADIAVGPPGVGEDGEVRFGLTSEAGFNDGLAFPVVGLGLALAAGTRIDAGWIANDFLWQVAVALAIGWGAGSALGWLTFRAPHLPLSGAASGLVAIGITAISYALAELAGGYGFIAVFVTALSLRAASPGHHFHRAMVDFIEQIERLLLMVILVLFGGAVALGLLQGLRWSDVGLALILLLAARPLTVLAGLLGSAPPPLARGTMAFFGIRGMGTLYYLAYASVHSHLAGAARLDAVVGFVVLGSIVIHGITATPMMRKIDQRLAAKAAAGG